MLAYVAFTFYWLHIMRLAINVKPHLPQCGEQRGDYPGILHDEGLLGVGHFNTHALYIPMPVLIRFIASIILHCAFMHHKPGCIKAGSVCGSSRLL